MSYGEVMKIMKITKKVFILFFALLLCFVLSNCSKKTPSAAISNPSDTDTPVKKKVLYVNSYHKGIPWSDGITKSILDVFNAKLNDDNSVDNSKSTSDLKVFYMDTKRNDSESYGQQTALKVKELIESWKPDAVIVSDDAAFKYVIMPHYRDAKLPVVFCGLNWDASIYGAPYKNTTGMLEIFLVPQLVDKLSDYTKGKNAAFLSDDTSISRKEASYYKKLFPSYVGDMTERYAKNFAEWKQYFVELQNNASIIFLFNNAAISDWDKDEAKKFVAENIRIPLGATGGWMADYAVVTLAGVPEEQGQWAANAAIQILNGTSPSQIPVTANKRTHVYLNMPLAKKIGIVFPIELINQAELIK
jgi:hypothetical protein